MKVSTSAQAMTADAVKTAATRLRESAQATIVRSFRDYLESGGPGPTDEELQTFARLAVAEQRLQRRFAEERTHTVYRGA